ncbi:MAG: hypothetical protein K0S41_4277 [Anaerocolumna sp.]|jgi:ribosomal-protein-alanine N-acetyltransferase|nr:hypothetical protein [Anaerocolumna sp.]
MGITIEKLDIDYCRDMAELLNSDQKLHFTLAPNKPHTRISGKEYYDVCKAWELRKNGSNFVILLDEKPIGSISYHNKDKLIAGCGYWIKSSIWGRGYGKEAFSMFLPFIKNAGFEYVTASILKDNIASWKIWANYTKDINKDVDRYTPIIKLI